MDETIRTDMALFPMRTVMELTHLTARQIRYYEQHDLVTPARTPGNKRYYSFNDVARLIQIKEWIDKGVNIAGIKQMIKPEPQATGKAVNTINAEQAKANRKELTNSEIHKLLKQQLMNGDIRQASLHQGDLSRYYSHAVSSDLGGNFYNGVHQRGYYS